MPAPADPVDPPPASAARRVVVVLGMHRSGTSLVAGCLRNSGVDFGPRLMPPDPDNPRGYFEHNDVVNLHDRLLLALDRSWDDPAPLPANWWHDDHLAPYQHQLLAILRRDFPAVPLWGLKDPRLCRLLPWWETVWLALGSRPLFLLVRRAPAEVAASLARREGVSAGKAYLLWLRHVLESERATRRHDRILLDFSAFQTDENAALEPVRRALHLPPSATTLTDPTLGRPAAASGLPLWVGVTDAALQLGLAGRETEMRATLDGVAAQLAACEPFLRSATPDPGDLAQQLAASRKQARWYEAEWRKAQARIDTIQTRLDAKSSKAKGT